MVAGVGTPYLLADYDRGLWMLDRSREAPRVLDDMAWR